MTIASFQFNNLDIIGKYFKHEHFLDDKVVLHFLSNGHNLGYK